MCKVRNHWASERKHSLKQPNTTNTTTGAPRKYHNYLLIPQHLFQLQSCAMLCPLNTMIPEAESTIGLYSPKMELSALDSASHPESTGWTEPSPSKISLCSEIFSFHLWRYKWKPKNLNQKTQVLALILPHVSCMTCPLSMTFLRGFFSFSYENNDPCLSPFKVLVRNMGNYFRQRTLKAKFTKQQ